MKKRFLLFTVFLLILVSCVDRFEKASTAYNEKLYDVALMHLAYIDKNDENAAKADSLRILIKETKKQIKREQQINDSIKSAKEFEEKQKERFELLEKQYSIIQFFNADNYTSSIADTEKAVDIFSKTAGVVNEFKNCGNKEMEAKAIDLEKKLKKTQVKAFPILRKNYVLLARQMLWEENIHVESANSGHKTIRFIGGVFANNKNKKDFQEKLESMFKKLRFTESNYLWNKYDEEYTYYSIYSYGDDEIVNSL